MFRPSSRVYNWPCRSSSRRCVQFRIFHFQRVVFRQVRRNASRSHPTFSHSYTYSSLAQPIRGCESGFHSFISLNRTLCGLGLLAVVFGSFPCKITANDPILPRANRRHSIPNSRLTVSTTYFLMVLLPESFERLLKWLHPNRDPTIKPFIPFRLELRDGRELRKWLSDWAVRREI